MRTENQVATNVLIPWRMPLYFHLNGYHPLMGSVVESQPKDINFIACDTYREPDEHSRFIVAEEYKASAMSIEASLNEPEAIAFINRLNSYYDPFMQYTIQTYSDVVDVVLHHTAPLSMNRIPFVVHFEQLTTLFHPFLFPGDTAGLKIRDHPMYRVLRAKLASPLCRGIFSHLRRSVESAIRCFDHDAITSKTCFIPLGVDIPAKYVQPVEKNSPNPVKIRAVSISCSRTPGSASRAASSFAAD